MPMTANGTIEVNPARAMHQLGRYANSLARVKPSKEQLKQALKLKRKIDALCRQLEVIVSMPDPIRAGERLVAELQKAEGGAWTGAELQAKFGLSAAVLHRRRNERRIVFWRDAKHSNYYPKWQFTETGALLSGIQEILQTFRSKDEWRVMRYFLGLRQQLGGNRPLDLLRSGVIERVLTHAREHAEENTW